METIKCMSTFLFNKVDRVSNECTGLACPDCLQKGEEVTFTDADKSARYCKDCKILWSVK